MDAKQVVRAYLERVVSGGDLDWADQLVAEDLVFTSPYTPEPTRSRAGFKAMIGALHAAFPDLRLEELATIAEGDLVASRWVASGTHTGAPLAGAPAGGRRFEIAGMSFYRVRDGRIVEGWVQDDTLGFAVQLGLVPDPARA